MSRGKYLSLEEARNTGKLERFAKEHPSQADGRFWPLLEAAAKVKPFGKGDANGKDNKSRNALKPERGRGE